MMVSGSVNSSRKRSMSSGTIPRRRRPSRTWRALAAITWVKPVPPLSNTTWPLAPVSTRAALAKMTPRVGREVVRATPLGQETVERGRHANDELVVGSGPIRRADLAGVEVLHDQPAARREPGHQLIEHVKAGRDVLQHEPFMNQVPRAFRDRSAHHVELTDVELRAAVVFEPSGVKINRHHVPVRPNPRGEPPSDGTTPATDLQAAGTRVNTDTAEVTDRDRIERVLQPLEPPGRFRMLVAHQVRGLRHGHHLSTQA